MDDTLRRTVPAEGSLALAENRSDRKRSLDALQELELRAGSPAPGREAQWLGQVLHSLDALEAVLAAQHENSADRDSMLSDIQRDQPRLHNRVVQLRRDYRDLHEAVSRFRAELETSRPDDIHFADVRQRLDRLATELRYQRAREADLVYEAFNVDLGAGD
jgi:small-conductance mechanosensitive channel